MTLYNNTLTQTHETNQTVKHPGGGWRGWDYKHQKEKENETMNQTERAAKSEQAEVVVMETWAKKNKGLKPFLQAMNQTEGERTMTKTTVGDEAMAGVLSEIYNKMIGEFAIEEAKRAMNPQQVAKKEVSLNVERFRDYMGRTLQAVYELAGGAEPTNENAEHFVGALFYLDKISEMAGLKQDTHFFQD